MARWPPVRWRIRFGVVFGFALVAGTFLVQQGTGSYSLFTLHPLLMLLAFLLLFSEGVAHYHLASGTLQRARLAHRAIFVSAAALAATAAVVILANKSRINHAWTPHTAHAVCGVTTLSLVLLQGLVGRYKLHKLLASDGLTKVMRWHGKMGLVVYVCGLVTIHLGFAEITDGFSLQVVDASLVCVGVLVVHTVLRRPRTVEGGEAYSTVAHDELDELDGDIDFNFEVEVKGGSIR